MAHLRQRSPGSWEIHFRANGETKTATVRGSHVEAKAKARELEQLAARGLRFERDTVGAFADRWLAAVEPDLSPMTMRNYRSTVETLIKPKLGNLKLIEADPATIRAALAELATTHKPSSIREFRRRLSAMFSFAMDCRLVASNPSAGWRRDKRAKTKREPFKTLNAGQLAELIDAARETPLFAPIVLAAGLGAREGEIAALRWSDIDDSGRVTIDKAMKEPGNGDVQIGPTKGCNERKIRLPASSFALIREYRRSQAEALLKLGYRIKPEDFVCLDYAGESMTPNRIGDGFRYLARKLGMKATYHTLRHSHASALVAAGMPIADVAARLGHADVATTIRFYLHPTATDDAGEADRLDAMLGG